MFKKASLALRMESRLENIFFDGVNNMSSAVWLGENRKCAAACGRFRFVVRVIYGTAVLMK